MSPRTPDDGQANLPLLDAGAVPSGHGTKALSPRRAVPIRLAIALLLAWPAAPWLTAAWSLASV